MASKQLHLSRLLQIGLISLGVVVVAASTVWALTDNNKIIEQTESYYNGVSADAINSFLSNRGSQLAGYTIPTSFDVYYPIGQGQWDKVSVAQQWQSPGGLEVYSGKSLAQLVYEWSTTERTNRGADSSPGQLNPLVALATMDKESASVIGNYRTDIVSSRPITLSWLMGYGFNDRMSSCVQSGNCDVNYNRQQATFYGGPGQQVAEGISALKRWSKNPTPLNSCGDGWQRMSIEGQCLNLANGITYALYRYTPNFSGQDLFLDRYNKIKQLFTVPAFPTILPLDGALVQAPGDPTVYVIDGGQKRKITSPEMFMSNHFHWEDRTYIGSDQLTQYSDGPTYNFRAGTLIQAPGEAAVYVVSIVSGAEQKRLIPSPDVFKALGYDWASILRTDANIVHAMPGGPAVTADSYPDGTWVKPADAPGVYEIDNGQKRHVANAQTFLSYRFRWEDVARIDSAKLAALPDGPALWYREGTLIKGSGPAIYVVDVTGGTTYQKRLIPSPDVFQALRFDWSRVYRVDDADLPAANGANVGS